MALYGVMHGLPLTYNKDLQEDKERLFDACDTLELSLDAAQGMVATMSFRRERLAAAATDEFLAATDIADLLVRRGLPFREAHGVVAGLVRQAVDAGKQLSELTPAELTAASPLLDDEYYRVLADRRLAGVQGLGGRHEPERGCASRCSGRAPRWREGRRFYDRPVVEVART